MYEALRANLPPASQAYWDSSLPMIGGGVLNAGRFERYVSRFRRAVLPLAPGRRAIRAMLSATSLGGQRRIYEERWDSRRWRLLFKLFFSRALLERFGRDRVFFAHSEINDIGAHYLSRTRHALTNVPIWSNPYLTWMMSGTFGADGRQPDYLKTAVQAVIRARIARIEAQTASLDDTLEALPSGSVDAFYLSDVFELYDPSAYASTLTEIARVGRPGARICYWNNLVSRRRPDSLAGELVSHPELSSRLHAQDRAFLYSAFVVESVRDAKA
jgi:S-adenosylmethionine-diacylglycerol 3-amino-3-carboxypropyl transferase